VAELPADGAADGAAVDGAGVTMGDGVLVGAGVLVAPRTLAVPVEVDELQAASRTATIETAATARNMLANRPREPARPTSELVPRKRKGRVQRFMRLLLELN
jgi:hypothetical protein